LRCFGKKSITFDGIKLKENSTREAF